MPKTVDIPIKIVGFLATLPPLLLALACYLHFQFGKSLGAFSVAKEWIHFRGMGTEEPYFAVNFELALSGFQLLLVVLTAVVATLSAIAAARFIKKGSKRLFHALPLVGNWYARCVHR